MLLMLIQFLCWILSAVLSANGGKLHSLSAGPHYMVQLDTWCTGVQSEMQEEGEAECYKLTAWKHYNRAVALGLA